MPAYTIETTCKVPVFRHRSYEADTPEAACKAALADDDWRSAKIGPRSSGDVHVTRIWAGAGTAYPGTSIPVPSQFHDATQRRARHFEILLGLLKMLCYDTRAAQQPSPDWLARAAWAISRGEAILAGAPDPDAPVDPPKPSHVLARLYEDRVRDAITAVLDVDTTFGTMSSGAVTDDDIHTACVIITSTIDLSDAIGETEFKAAMSALRIAHERIRRD